MSSMTDYAEKAVLDHTLGTSPMAMPNVYVALYTQAPTEDSSGNEVADGRGYSRQPVSFDNAQVDVDGITKATNNHILSFGPNTNVDWGIVVGAALVDSQAHDEGNVLYYAEFDSARDVKIGDRIEIAAGGIVVTLD